MKKNKDIITLCFICLATSLFTIDMGIVTGYDNTTIAPMMIIKKNNFFIMPGVENKTIGLVLGYEYVF